MYYRIPNFSRAFIFGYKIKARTLMYKRGLSFCPCNRDVSWTRNSGFVDFQPHLGNVKHKFLHPTGTSIFVLGETQSLQPTWKQQSRHISTQPYYDFSVVVGFQSIFEMVHSYTQLPWWTVIMLVTLTLRPLITLPLARKQACILAQIELLKPFIDELSEALKHNLAVKGRRENKPVEEVNKEYKKQFRKYTYDLYKENNCNPLKLFILPWVQIPLWIVISLALRNLSGFVPGASKNVDDTNLDAVGHATPGLQTEGLLWFSDLSIPDPLFILPIIVGLTNLANIEFNSLRKNTPSGRERAMTGIFRLLSITMIGVATQVPSAMTLYWATSSSYGLVQNVLLRAPSVRRFLKIPQTPTESKTPYRDIVNIIRLKVHNFVKIQRL